jgi:PAS domain S-box-containing protein
MAKIEDDLIQQIAALQALNQTLQARLEEAEEALLAIGSGQVDALVVYGDQEERIYSLQGTDYAYRMMVESIHEGAANITESGVILYANKRMAEMLHRPLEGVLGSSIYPLLLPGEKEAFAALVSKGLDSFASAEFTLKSANERSVPVLITASAAEVDGRRGVCLVVTDLTEQKASLARERELQLRLAAQREEERVRIARNLHDGPLQDVIGLSFKLQEMILDNQETVRLAELSAVRESITKLAEELRGVCNELRPSSSIRFGLAKAIQFHSQEIQTRHPALILNLELAQDEPAVPNDVRTALFQIYQECMNNILRHAKASQVNIRLFFDPISVLLEVQDNGIGFLPPEEWIELARQGHLGLVGMRERAEVIGGSLRVISDHGQGTTIQVEVPS